VTGEGRKAGVKLIAADLALFAAALVVARARPLTAPGRPD
jgi:hypothetical protein